MAQQKSEGRVLLEGGVMPAERAGSSPGSQGKAIPVDQTAWQLCLPIATAEDPRGSARVAASNLSGTVQAGVPQAIINAEQVTSVTMEGVSTGTSQLLLVRRTAISSGSLCGLTRRLSPWRFCFPSAPSAWRCRRSVSSRRDCGGGPFRGASCGSTRG